MHIKYKGINNFKSSDLKSTCVKLWPWVDQSIWQKSIVFSSLSEKEHASERPGNLPAETQPLCCFPPLKEQNDRNNSKKDSQSIISMKKRKTVPEKPIRFVALLVESEATFSAVSLSAACSCRNVCRMLWSCSHITAIKAQDTSSGSMSSQELRAQKR